MNFQMGSNVPCQTSKSKVLNNNSIHPTGIEQAQLLFRGLHLTGEDQRVHGHKSTHPMLVQELHQLGQILFREIISSKSGVKLGQAKENGICTIRHRGTGTIPISCR